MRCTARTRNFSSPDGSGPAVRELVAESWRISAEAGVDADDPAVPVVVHGAQLQEYREAHPLSHVFPLLYDVLGRAAEECDSVMAVGDAHGQLLWVCGRPSVLARAERINFVEGAAWDEAHAGTNAPGTALRLDQPLQILASEHFVRPVQPWTCAAAPIHDPITQGILGIVDITGSEAVASPQTLAMVRAAARMAEAELGRIVATSSPEELWRPVPRASVEALGRPDCQLTLGGKRLRLSPRHSEILVILVDHPDGLTGDELAVELYRDDVSRSTMRAELTRLRNLLGDDLLDSRPYRLRTRAVLRLADGAARDRVGTSRCGACAPIAARCCRTPTRRASCGDASGSSGNCALRCSRPARWI